MRQLHFGIVSPCCLRCPHILTMKYSSPPPKQPRNVLRGSRFSQNLHVSTHMRKKQKRKQQNALPILGICTRATHRKPAARVRCNGPARCNTNACALHQRPTTPMRSLPPTTAPHAGRQHTTEDAKNCQAKLCKPTATRWHSKQHEAQRLQHSCDIAGRPGNNENNRACGHAARQRAAMQRDKQHATRHHNIEPVTTPCNMSARRAIRQHGVQHVAPTCNMCARRATCRPDLQHVRTASNEPPAHMKRQCSHATTCNTSARRATCHRDMQHATPTCRNHG
jgi:hypothetical protein